MADLTESMLNHIYTLDEAAERLRINKRMVTKVARRAGACSRAGREYLFTEDDLLEVWKAMRVEPTSERLSHGVTLTETSQDASARALAFVTRRKKKSSVQR